MRGSALRATPGGERVKVGDMILVCDVGGGTTDFSLIGVADQGGDLVLTRLAVGEHILLGGDNMDLALAYAVAANLPRGMDGLDLGQRIALNYSCRAAKEALFANPHLKVAPVAILGPRLEGDRRHDQGRIDASPARRDAPRRLLPRVCQERCPDRATVVSA